MKAKSARSRFVDAALVVLAVAVVLGTITAPVLADESGSEVVTAEVSGPAIQVTDAAGPPEPVPWTTKYLIPTSVALAMVIVAATSLQYYLAVVRKRYRVAE